MDSDFEQQFVQNVKTGAAQPGVAPTGTPTVATPAAPAPTSAAAPSASHSPLALVVSLLLAVVVLIESVVLVITLSNYFALSGGNTAAEVEDEEEYVDESYTESAYSYNTAGDLTAFDGECKSTDGAILKLTRANTYEKRDSGGNTVESGNYEINRGNLIVTSSNGVMYYDGYSVADGLVIYDCELSEVESDTE